MRKRKRLLSMGDLHCGSKVGLTHPDWDQRPRTEPELTIYKYRRACWDWYVKEVADLGQIDGEIDNGDLITGSEEKNGGLDLIQGNRLEQAKMAVACLEVTRCKKHYISFGTPYHTGKAEQYERQVADGINAVKISNHDWLDVNGCIFDYKHKVGSSSVPHGRGTALARAAMWNREWSHAFPKANVLLRSHVHYFHADGDHRYMAFSLPSMQGLGTDYGERECEGLVHFGFMHFDIEGDGSFTWHAHILEPKPYRAQVL